MFPKLYAILDIDSVNARGLEPRAVARDWLKAGVRLIQLRAKNMASGELLLLATELAHLAHAGGPQQRLADDAETGGGAEFVLNDRADIASMAGADGVHLGQGDLKPSDVLRVLRNPRDLRVIGLSTHNLEQLRAGLDEPATYFAMGPVFETSSKADAEPVVGLAGVRAARELLDSRGDPRPLVAIGGITPERMPDVFEAGAASVAVISGLFTYRITSFLPEAF